jgi:hypothetical protein
VVAGVLAKLADLAPGVLGWLGDLGSALGPWVVLVVLVARRASSRSRAAIDAAALLCASLVGYYVTYRAIDGNVDGLVVVFWMLGALTAGPLLAVVVRVAGRGDLWGAAAAAVPAGLLLGEAISASSPDLAERWLISAFDVVAAVVLLVRPAADRRVLAWLPLLVAVGFGLRWLPRLVLGIWIGGA